VRRHGWGVRSLPSSASAQQEVPQHAEQSQELEAAESEGESVGHDDALPTGEQVPATPVRYPTSGRSCAWLPERHVEDASAASFEDELTDQRSNRPAMQDVPLVQSAVLAVGTLQPEERALSAVGALLLVDEVEPPAVERPEPLLPADVAKR